MIWRCILNINVLSGHAIRFICTDIDLQVYDISVEDLFSNPELSLELVNDLVLSVAKSLNGIFECSLSAQMTIISSHSIAIDVLSDQEIFRSMMDPELHKLLNEATEYSTNLSNQNGEHVERTDGFIFHNLEDIQSASKLFVNYNIKSELYKDYAYTLVVYSDGLPELLYDKVCSMLSEYGTHTSITKNNIAYFKENGYLITDDIINKFAHIT